MSKSLILLCLALAMSPCTGLAQVAVHLEPADLHGSRPVSEQTSAAVIRDYLQSWQSLRSAMEQNRADLLEPSFVGMARDKFAETVQQQAVLGIRTKYQDSSHDIQIIFYSPEGLSMELTDKVDYDVEVIDHDHIKTKQRISARYVVVMTPAEVRWRVRVLQGAPLRF